MMSDETVEERDYIGYNSLVDERPKLVKRADAGGRGK